MKNKIKFLQNKKVWLGVFILFAALNILLFTTKNRSHKDIQPNNLSNVLGNQSGCDEGTVIEYFSYKETDINFENNNKFGLYIYAEYKDYLEIAQNLVNSDGGEWGYVLIPYNVKDRDYSKWSEVFTRLNNKKLIPIIQLWDVDVDDYKKQTIESARFLNQFLWPIKYRYISVYNEVNDSNFWYGYVNPQEYAEIFDYTINTYKNTNPDFYMMNGAFNVSAADNSDSMDSFRFMSEMNNHIPGIFNKLDGWASHPYPQPNFSGSPYDSGRWSIRAYIDELEFLKNNLGVTKELPVFITETGWAHAEGENYNNSYLGVNTISDYFKIAYEQFWLPDSRVRAVTPFTVRYKPPFDHFSWVDKNEIPYKHYETIKSIPKVKGEPPILQKNTYKSSDCI